MLRRVCQESSIEYKERNEEEQMNNASILTGIQADLFTMQDIKYRDFHSKLMPTVDKELVIGVRTPQLRKYSKELYKNQREEAEKFMNTLPHIYYEENNVHAFLIEQIKDYEECIEALDAFLPYIDNWATCDMMNPKVFKKHRSQLITEVRRWLASEHTYMVRFAIKVLMDYYLDEAFEPQYPDMVARISGEEYYIKMVIAWYFATALAKQYDEILPYIEENRLDIWTHNKAIQKAVESYRITSEQKTYLKTLKRKEA